MLLYILGWTSSLLMSDTVGQWPNNPRAVKWDIASMKEIWDYMEVLGIWTFPIINVLQLKIRKIMKPNKVNCSQEVDWWKNGGSWKTNNGILEKTWKSTGRKQLNQRGIQLAETKRKTKSITYLITFNIIKINILFNRLRIFNVKIV